MRNASKLHQTSDLTIRLATVSNASENEFPNLNIRDLAFGFEMRVAHLARARSVADGGKEGSRHTPTQNKRALTKASARRLWAPVEIRARIWSSSVSSSISTELLCRLQVNPSPTDSTSNLMDLCLAMTSSNTSSWLKRIG